MSTKLIFDLDWTLYSENDVIDITNTTFYNSFKKKHLLNLLLKKLNYNKYIFSNGNESHVMDVLRRMQIKSFFKNIATSDDYNNKLKPNIAPYQFVIEKFNIKKNDNIYFFEDTLENLVTAKQLGWKTVLISKNKSLKRSIFVDLVYNTIEEALRDLIRKPYLLNSFISNNRQIN